MICSDISLQASKLDDQLPVSADGRVLDIHATAIVSIIDALTAGRSNALVHVLTPMKAVMNTVSTIVEDVRLFECVDINQEVLRSLRQWAEAMLNNFVAAHATSSEMSPISLLNAAASHIGFHHRDRAHCLHTEGQRHRAGRRQAFFVLCLEWLFPVLVRCRGDQAASKKASSASSRKMEAFKMFSSRYEGVAADCTRVEFYGGERCEGADEVMIFSFLLSFFLSFSLSMLSFPLIF